MLRFGRFDDGQFIVSFSDILVLFLFFIVIETATVVLALFQEMPAVIGIHRVP